MPTQVLHNYKACWIMEEENKWVSVEEMEFTEIIEIDINKITAKLHNWKSSGINKIHNFWYKQLFLYIRSENSISFNKYNFISSKFLPPPPPPITSLFLLLSLQT